jgi:hypothetical protein
MSPAIYSNISYISGFLDDYEPTKPRSQYPKGVQIAAICLEGGRIISGREEIEVNRFQLVEEI